ncbi:MAG: GDP-L-fucose synthase [Gemmataceae bacterium]
MNRLSRIFVSGGDTLIGSALLDHLSDRGFINLVGVGAYEPDPTDADAVADFFHQMRPEYVFLTAGRSGGIGLNRTRPADLMLNNLRVAGNVLESAAGVGVKKLLYLASSCSYPRLAPQPMAVESLLAGPVEATSESYATAKIAGWKLCDAFRRQYGCNFITGIPANAFGPNDDFDSESGHVIPALLRRFHDAKLRNLPEVAIWGSGSPRREFIFSRDLADACLFAMKHYDGDAPINLGGGTDLSIADAARAIAEVTGYRGKLVFDASKPDGAPLKALDSSVLLNAGWKPQCDFRSALVETYRWFRGSIATGVPLSKAA